MSTNGRFEDPVDQRNQQPTGPNFFPERWNGGDTQVQQAPNTQQRLYDSAYQGSPDRQQYRQDVPQEFGRQPTFCQHDGQGNTYNFYIREANINMGNQTPGYDYRRNPQYDYRQYDPNCQQNRRINYYDDPYAQMYEQQARQQAMRQYQYEQAMWQRQQMMNRYNRDRYYDQYYPQQPMNVWQDGVHGGSDGYTASRTRINTGGYDNGYYGTPPFVPDYGGGRNDMDRFIDLGFGVLDRVFANEANRRASRNGGYDNRYYPTQQPQYAGQNYYGNDYAYNQSSAYRRGPQRSPQQAMPPGYNDVIRRRGY